MNQFLRRCVIYVLGLFVLSFGVTISVKSNLGVSPVNSLPYVISLITKRELGLCIVAVFSIYIVAQIVILGKEFQWHNLFQILCSTAFGYFTTLSKWILRDFAIPGYPGRLLMMAIGIVLVASGVFLYMDVDLINMPMEGLTQALAKKIFKSMQFHEVKIITDCANVLLGIVLSFVFLHELKGIREGTVLSALLVGRVMKVLKKYLSPSIERFCRGSAVKLKA